MKKTIVLLLSVAIILGCMALPVSATIFVYFTNMTSQYQGAFLYDQGSALVAADSTTRAAIALVDANRVARGKKCEDFRDRELKTITTYWVDHAYHSTNVVCVETYRGY